MPDNVTIQVASVKVMRSHDYCHFEVSLASADAATPELVDELRKTAARLADKAVAQYKTAKAAHARLDRISQKSELDYAQSTPVGERSPELKAVIKFHEDKDFAKRFDYDYEDDWKEPESH